MLRIPPPLRAGEMIWSGSTHRLTFIISKDPATTGRPSRGNTLTSKRQWLRETAPRPKANKSSPAELVGLRLRIPFLYCALEAETATIETVRSYLRCGNSVDFPEPLVVHSPPTGRPA